MGISELRKKGVLTLAHRLADKEKRSLNNEDVQLAIHTMNIYYQLCGKYVRLVELENDAFWHDKPVTKELREKAEKQEKKLIPLLKQFDADLCWYSHLPTIVDLKAKEHLYVEHFY